MKIFIFFFFFLFFSASVNAQKTHTQYVIDTLATGTDSTYAKITTIRNDSIIEVRTAYLYNDSVKFRRYLFFIPLPLKKYVPALRIVRHGESVKYEYPNKKIVSQYQFGKQVDVSYFKDSKVIGKDEYNNHLMTIICSTPKGEYLITPRPR